MMNSRILFAVLVLSALGGCSLMPKPSTLATTQSTSTSKFAANDSLDATLWTQTAIEHDLVYREVYHLAEEKLLKALSDPAWEALPKGERTSDGKDLSPAVIVDIDETVLDNSPFQARLIRDEAGFNEIAWRVWCQQHAAHALPGALEFAKFAAAHGVTMIYISNRAQTLAAVTQQNLMEQGFPLAENEVTVFAAESLTPGCDEKSGEKGCRRKLVAQKHRILLMLGDQLGDFVDGSQSTVAARRTLADSYKDWFGERWFVLPNPSYGVWQTAVTAHPAAAALKVDQRAAKRAALHEN
jgi:5'-nucleotidase (lipoprotein e(P4) family)